MSRVTLTASWVVPVDRPPVREGQVVVEEGRVAWVGAREERAPSPSGVRDLGPGVLLPGLVNAHCHLELSHLAGRVPLGVGFVPWVEALVEARPRFTREQTLAGTAAAIGRLEDSGTAAVGDVSNRLDHLGLLSRSTLRAVAFLEVLAWDPARAPETEAWIDERMSAAEASGVEVRLAAHAPHSVSPRLIARLVARGGVGSIHLAESPEETRFLARGDGPWAAFLDRRGLGHVVFAPPGTSPVTYADGLGLLCPGVLVVHGVQLDAADRARLARRGVSLVLCPRSNRNLGVGAADVPALLEAGVPLCLGSDSLASAESLDVLDDAALLAREFPNLDAAVLVRMATLGGAEALGLDELGTLAPGKRAVMAFVPADAPPDDPHAHVVSGGRKPRRVTVEES